jgi:hypothetical protein
MAAMLNRRQRALSWAAVVIAAVWLAALTGHGLAGRSRMTAEKFQRYVQGVDLAKLSGAERVRALRALAEKLNALPPEERRLVRLRRDWEPWFSQMTEAEREAFVEATFPAGVRQMIAAFEQMPEDRRRRTMDEALKRLREEAEWASDAGPPPPGASLFSTNAPPPISRELERKIRTAGLQTFFTEASAQTKAEVAPLLEEMQRVMERGGRFRGRNR